MPIHRRLDESHTICIRSAYPKQKNGRMGYRYLVTIGVGGNVGDMGRRFDKLWVYLSRQSRMAPVRSGVILRNPPFGYLEQADFENTVIEIATSLTPRALLRYLWRIEQHFGRKRSFPNAPRTLDLDMIFFENRVIKFPELTVPHPQWKERISVLIPWRSLKYNASTRRRRYENLNV